MSKKDLRDRWKSGWIHSDSKWVGKLLQRYMLKRTTKRKHPKNYED